MSFDVVIWAGEPPADDASALAEFNRLVAQMDRDVDQDVTPSTDPRVLKCLKELTSNYSDGLLGLLAARVFGPVWAMVPLTPHGSILYLHLSWGVRPKVLEFIARTAAKHGLVCFDPQESKLVDPRNPRALAESYVRSNDKFHDLVDHLRGK